jgi:hypothetical protein
VVVATAWITVVLAEAIIARAAAVCTFGGHVLDDEIRAVTLIRVPIHAAVQAIICFELPGLAAPSRNLELEARFGRASLAFVGMGLKFEASLASPWDAGGCPGNRQDFAEGTDRHDKQDQQDGCPFHQRERDSLHTGGYSLHQWCCLTHRICLSAQLPGGRDHRRWHTQRAHRGRSSLDLFLPSLAVRARDGL